MIIFVFIIGLLVGSFFNVVISRLDREGGILMGRSHCPKCKSQLAWHDLIPLLSYLLLRGRCRNCKESISPIYPVVELTTAIILVLFYLKIGLPLDIGSSYYLIILSFFILIIFFDYLYYVIPDKLVLPLIVYSLIYSYLFRRPELFNLLTSGLALGGFFAILYVVSHGKWIGLGDAKLSLLIGLVLGYPLGALAVVFSIWIAALVGMVLIIMRRASLKSELPFGSFLSIISIIFIIFQNELQILNTFF